MKTIFKNKKKTIFSLVFILTSIVSFGFFMQSCNGDFDSETNIVKLDIPEEYNEVGKLHNEGLEYIFQEIKAEGIEYTKNPRFKSRTFMENKDEFIKQATRF